jgi:uncharacterized protein (DUF1697 family)
MIYVALLRGINVGGNNKVPMADLKACLEDLGYEHVRTYINSGNVIFTSDGSAEQAAKRIEDVLLKSFKATFVPIKVLVISRNQLAAIVAKAPPGFGQEPGKYHSDVVFLIGKSVAEAMQHVEVHPEVDVAWAGDEAIYYRRLSAKRTKSRLPKIAGKPIYKSMTIRSWSTVSKLYALMEDIEQ